MLLRTLILDEMFVLNASSAILYAPHSVFSFEDRRHVSSSKVCLIKSVGNELSDCVYEVPVFKKFIDVKVEVLHGNRHLTGGFK